MNIFILLFMPVQKTWKPYDLWGPKTDILIFYYCGLEGILAHSKELLRIKNEKLLSFLKDQYTTRLLNTKNY